MNTAVKLSAYGAALALLVTGAYVVGTAVSPLTTQVANAGDLGETPGAGSAGHGDTHSGTVAEATGAESARPADSSADQPGGLASSRGGYTLTPTDPTPTTGTFSFTITGPDGAPVTAFDVEHDKRMHLIVVRRDTTAFQHVHPEMAADGTWSVPLTLPAGGSYRAFADFAPTGGEGITLGTDLSMPGTYDPAEHETSRTAIVEGYQVVLAGELVAGQARP